MSDADGLIVIPGTIAEDIIALSEELARIERLIATDMKAGIKREVAMNPPSV